MIQISEKEDRGARERRRVGGESPKLLSRTFPGIKSRAEVEG